MSPSVSLSFSRFVRLVAPTAPSPPPVLHPLGCPRDLGSCSSPLLPQLWSLFVCLEFFWCWYCWNSLGFSLLSSLYWLLDRKIVELQWSFRVFVLGTCLVPPMANFQQGLPGTWFSSPSSLFINWLSCI